jgi:LytS/YehU family sensor histidine kinase
VLATGVWWLSRRVRWPDRLSPRFLLIHLLAGLTFVSVHFGFDVACYALATGRTVASVFQDARRFLPFEVVTDLFLYGLIAGVSYTLRAERRARDERLAAAQAEAAAARDQLGALRAQLHPHFLFNSLHSVAALIRHEPDAAETAVERLGELLRYALDSGHELVPLAEEWRFTRDYLALEELRLGERLRVTADLEDEALESLVPAFTLQPLVENAVRHAVAPRAQGGQVQILGRVEGDRLLLSVRDDGPGARSESVGEGPGLGLRLVRDRLATLCGESARLSIETGPGSGFAVSVSLPLPQPAAP